MARQDIAPAYEVEELQGTLRRKRFYYERKYLRDEDGEIVLDDQGRKTIESRQRVEKVVEVPAGWMVYFPRGHSVRIETAAEMVRLGFMEEAELIDLDSEAEDNIVPQPAATSLKERSAQRVARNRKGRASATSATNAEVAET